MKFSTPFTLAATTLFMIIGSTDAHLRGQRSLEDTDDVGGDCTGAYQDPFAFGKIVPCCAGLDMELEAWDGDGHLYNKCMIKDTGNFQCYEYACDAPASSPPPPLAHCDTAEKCDSVCKGAWQKPCPPSDDNRALVEGQEAKEVKEVPGTSDNDDHKCPVDQPDEGDTCADWLIGKPELKIYGLFCPYHDNVWGHITCVCTWPRQQWNCRRI